ncbi:MAG: hypothetical protein AAGG09_00985 [Pseudomonadota bacterium]
MTKIPCVPVLGCAVTAAVFLAGAGAALAQEDRPSIDCGAASGVVTAMVCSDTQIGASDGRLARHVDSVVSILEEDDSDDAAEAMTAFEESQEAWVATRDACRRSGDPRACVAEAYADREAQLVTTFQLEEPANTASYTCPGEAAGGLSISFYDLETRAVRIEGAGDEAVTGKATTTVDGAKYALSSGQEVWVRKDVARFTAADGTSVTCLIEDG